MYCEPVESYINNTKCDLPFFYVVGDKNYARVCKQLRQRGLDEIRMSDQCVHCDKFPSIDTLIQTLQSSHSNLLLIIGVGELLALRGEKQTIRALMHLKDIPLHGKKVVFLLRGIPHQAKTMIQNDHKLLPQQRATVEDDVFYDLSIVSMTYDDSAAANDGIYDNIQCLLRAMEDGAKGTLNVHTQLDLQASLLPIKFLRDDYDIIAYQIKRHHHQPFYLQKTLGAPEQWQQFRASLHTCQYDIQRLFEQTLGTRIVKTTWKDLVSDHTYINWLMFLYFKQNSEHIHNTYLKYTIDHTDDFQTFKQNLLECFATIKPNDPQFDQLYDDRKILFEGISDNDIQIFLKKNEIQSAESIYRLTDLTLPERKAIIKWLSTNDCDENTRKIILHHYPALDHYLSFYAFNGPLSEELTSYFDTYKHLKVLNRVSDDFLRRVELYAEKQCYTQLETLNNCIRYIDDKAHAKLYWIDALGVEYLSFITFLAKQKDLSLHIDICRSYLPTITSINHAFFDDWAFDKYKDSRLDELKHKETSSYFYTKEQSPIHLAEELDIITDAMNTIENELKCGKYQSFIIASDHGASRLAVIHQQEAPYETDTKGEHSGRCCPYFEGCHVPHQCVENGYIVLSDYGRFRGSRKANVEVHGGATLEEIVVPLITVTLRKHDPLSIVVCQPDDITVNLHDGVTLEIYLSHSFSPTNLVLFIDTMTYPCARAKDDHHFVFQLPHIKRARTEPFTASLYEGNNLLGNLSFKVKSKSAKVRDDFDFDDDF